MAKKKESMVEFMEKLNPSGGDQGSLAPQFSPKAKVRSTSDGYMHAEKPAAKKKTAVKKSNK